MKNQKMTVNRKILLKLLSVAFPHTVQKKKLFEFEFHVASKVKEFPNSFIDSTYRNLYKQWCEDKKVLDDVSRPPNS